MSRTVLLVGGPGHHRRAVREALRYEGVAAMEAEGAQLALALLREAAFDVVVVSDEPRRLALQGLFAQLRRAQPVPAMFLLPLPEGDKVDIDTAKAIALMVANPSMIKRPVVEGGKALLVGFKESEWDALLSQN